MKLRATAYRRKNINAYLAPITIQGSKIHRSKFINFNPIDEEKERYFKEQSAVVEIELPTLRDGLYELREASGHKSSTRYVWIAKGEIQQEWDSLSELLDTISPPPEMPPLEGSEKQISWAEAIRLNAIRDGIPAAMASRKSLKAKDWIDNRDRIDLWFASYWVDGEI